MTTAEPIRIDLLGADEVAAALDRAADAQADMTKLMSTIGDSILRSTKQRFGSGTAPDGTPWAPKTQATIDAYTRRGDRVDFRPLFGPSRVNAGLNATIQRRSDATSVEIGSEKTYAAVMQFGAAQGAFGTNAAGRPIPWGDIPARPFLGLSDQDRTDIAAEIEEWLAGTVSPAKS